MEVNYTHTTAAASDFHGHRGPALLGAAAGFSPPAVWRRVGAAVPSEALPWPLPSLVRAPELPSSSGPAFPPASVWRKLSFFLKNET